MSSEEEDKGKESAPSGASLDDDEDVREPTGPRGDLVVEVMAGAITKSPVWENHKRGRNWAAYIWAEPRMPGGLGRKFWDRGAGDFVYIVPPGLERGDAVEFGADYVTGVGRRYAKRWYGVVIEWNESRLVLRHCVKAIDALRLSDAMNAPVGAKAAQPSAI